MDSFFAKGFKAAKCKTLLKLTIPRIKLLRNRREIQLKQMRKEIAKLLETGQEATARIRVEHIIREEKMMAAQEIVELFCELIAVRLPIIEAQRECPLDLKEAISSVCFAAPRCADLPELLQVQMLFAGKYGKEFIAAATELLPECGVNRQLIELLSVRAPAPDVKLKLLKEIAEEHQLDWDPNASETELLKSHEDLLNGPTQFVSGAKVPVPLPKERFDEVQQSASDQVYDKQTESEADFEWLDFPEVPKQPLRPSPGGVSAPEMLPFPASALSDFDEEVAKPSEDGEIKSHKQNVERDDILQEKVVSKDFGSADTLSAPEEEKQFLPFMIPPPKSSPVSSTENTTAQSTQAPCSTKTKVDTDVDLQDVLAAAQAAADSAERAAAAARSAASLAQVRISELTRRRSEEVPVSPSENPFYAEKQESHILEKPPSDLQHQLSSSDGIPSPLHGSPLEHQVSNIPSYDDSTVGSESPIFHMHHPGQGSGLQPQRLPSLDDETYNSYPNLFNTTNGSNPSSRSESFKDNIRSSHDK